MIKLSKVEKVDVAQDNYALRLKRSRQSPAVDQLATLLQAYPASVAIRKFAAFRGSFMSELLNRSDTNNYMVLVWLRIRSSFASVLQIMQRTSNPPH